MIVREIIEPKSIVVVGGSNDTRKPGGKVLENIIRGNFDGELFVVNPKEKVVQNIQAFPSCEELPPVELAIFAIPAGLIPDVMEQLTERGTRAFIVLSAGFSEMGEEGKKLEEKIIDIVEKVDGTLIGPNCIGVITKKYKGVFAGPIPEYAQMGCDFVSASGATAVFILEEAIVRGIRFSEIFSVGNSAQIGIEEVLEYWDQTYQPGFSSKVKLIYAEQISNPKKFLEHCISLKEKGCRIAAIKAGRTKAGQRAVSSHTGALAGEDTAVELLFRKAGIIRCEGRLDLVNVAGVLLGNKPKGDRVAIVTHAGGPGVMLADTLESEGVKVPKIEGEYAQELLGKLNYGSSVANPIDFLATGTAEQLDLILDFTENKFDNIDSVGVIFGTPGLFDVTNVYQILFQRQQNSKKPIFAIVPSIVQAHDAIEKYKSLGGNYFNDEVSFGKALAKVLKIELKEKGEVREFEDIDKDTVRRIINNSPNGFLPINETISLLNAVGIPFVRTLIVKNIPELEEALSKLGFPVVLKVIGPLHKTDLGGVVLGINSFNEAEQKYNELMKIPNAVGVQVQPMMKGTELFFGVKYEKDFGHIIAFGLGGIFVEIMKDVAMNLAPLTTAEAKEMIDSIKGKSIIEGARSRNIIDKETISNILLRISNLLQIAPEILEMDINPAFATSKGIVAVDARIKV